MFADLFHLIYSAFENTKQRLIVLSDSFNFTDAVEKQSKFKSYTSGKTFVQKLIDFVLHLLLLLYWLLSKEMIDIFLYKYTRKLVFIGMQLCIVPEHQSPLIWSPEIGFNFQRAACMHCLVIVGLLQSPVFLSAFSQSTRHQF